MICKLCLEEKPLLKKSHIIPNFMYKGIFGQEKKIVQINTDNLEKKSTLFSGIYDKNILCSSCDNEIIGKLETYASLILYGHGNPNKRKHIRTERIKAPDGLLSIRFHNLDYTKMKLFFLSILWRSHISKQDFFKAVDLGNYQEKLRKMILNNDAGNDDDFEVVLAAIESDGSRPYRSIIDPRRMTLEGNTWYVFHINQVFYHFNVSSYNKMPIFEKGIIKKDGVMDVAVLSNQFARGYFDSFVGKSIYVKNNIK